MNDNDSNWSAPAPERGRTWVVLTIVFALGTVLVWLRRERGVETAAVDRSRGPELRESPLPVFAPEFADEPRHAAGDAAPSEGGRVATSEAPPATWRLEGVVYEVDGAQPVADVDVSIRPPRHVALPATAGAEAKTFESVVARTDANGAFAVDLDARCWRVNDVTNVTVEGPLGRLFLGPVRLTDARLVLHARLVRIAHGRVVGDVDPGAREVWVTFSAPSNRIRSSSIFAGRARVQANREFDAALLLDAEPRELEVIASIDEVQQPAALVSADALFSTVGAELLLETRPLTVTVASDEDRAPLAGADVRIGAIGGGSGTVSIAQTGADGTTTLSIAPVPIEVCAAKTGYRPVVAEVVPTPDGSFAPVSLALERMQPTDLVRGVVLRADGRPIADAHVSVAPHAQVGNVAIAGVASARSDANGKFSLEAASPNGLDARAYHRDYGLSDPVEVADSASHAVEIRLPALGPLTVTVESYALQGPFSSGPIEYVLADRVRSNFVSGHDWGLPLRIDEVPQGEYNLYVYLPGLDAFGATTCSVTAGKPSEVRMTVEPTEWVEGAVRTSSGAPCAGCTVVCSSADWPLEVSQAWGTSKTDERGRFRALLGAAGRVEISATAPNGERATATATRPIGSIELRLGR